MSKISGLSAVTEPLAADDEIAIVDKSDPTQAISGTTKRVTFGQLAQVIENEQTGTSYTLIAGDAGKQISMNNAAANTCTVPPNSSVAFPIGTVVYVKQKGAGQTTLVAGSGVTINVAPSKGLKIVEQHETIMLRKDGTDTWTATGALAV